MGYKLLKGNCLKKMKKLQDNSVDLVLMDPPYGMTAAKWDKVIESDRLFREFRRILKPKSAIIIFAAQPFTSYLITEQRKWYRHSWVWKKNLATNFFHAKRMPLRITEDILVFGFQSPRYFPQKTRGHKPTQSAKGRSRGNLYHGKNNRDYLGGDTTRFPNNLLEYKVVDPKLRIHSSQKPIELLEYLINTYSEPGSTILDPTMGSGSSGVAALKLYRKFIGIEKNPETFKSAKQWIKSVSKELKCSS